MEDNLGFPPPPFGHEWHNPQCITAEDLGVSEGWRLLTKKENTFLGDIIASCCRQNKNFPDSPIKCEMVVRLAIKDWGEGYGSSEHRTYRTKEPLPELFNQQWKTD